MAMNAPDITSALRNAENALRDLIQQLMVKNFGEAWPRKLGVTDERRQRWEERRIEEQKRLTTGGVESRLLYFADFTDLKTILARNWEIFKEVFGDKKEIEVFLSKLEDFRNPDAHQRGLSEYQEHLALGISGELRTQIARYRSRRDTAEDCFPSIEAAFDNYGRVYPEIQPEKESIPTLRVGDMIEITLNAVDPEDMPVDYQFSYSGSKYSRQWGEQNRFFLELTEEHIRHRLAIICSVKSRRAFHAFPSWDGDDYDDALVFAYQVLPSRTNAEK